MHGIRRVMVFCTLTTVLPTMLLVIPLYLRHSFYANVAYAVTESDILEITDGISTLFCSEHTLQMNGTFNAFQMSHKPEITSYRKHIRLKKSMSLPDDTLEYWGFYLLKGATVALSVCSRFQGASILVVKGERNLRTCGMLDHNTNKQLAQGIFLPDANRQVKITFESNAQEINSEEAAPEVTPQVTTEDPSKRNLPEKGNTETATVATSATASETVTAGTVSTSTTETTTATATVDFGVNNETSTRGYEGPDPDTKNRTGSMEDEELAELYRNAATYLRKHTEQKDASEPRRRLRHARHRNHLRNMQKVNSERSNPADHHHRLEALRTRLISEDALEERSRRSQDGGQRRHRRSQELMKPPSLLDQGIMHGGNARNTTDPEDKSSVSSFETGLLNCYGGSILLAEEFEPSDQCTNVSYLLTGKHMQTRHNVVEDGYYYYIFYSDNDIVSNDIHALFDIYKPTFQYENVTDSCLNETRCTFNLELMSKDRVIVEIPTRDGIEHEIDDVNLLVSICSPRMGAYAVFPIAVLFLILGCAFM